MSVNYSQYRGSVEMFNYSDFSAQSKVPHLQQLCTTTTTTTTTTTITATTTTRCLQVYLYDLDCVVL